MTTTVKVLHLLNTRDNHIDWRKDVIRMLTNGEYCLAGEIEVDDSMVDINAGSNELIYAGVLDGAYLKTQNDAHPNPVTGYSDGMPQYGPAVWNGVFAQRSSMIGDLIVVDGHIFRVQGVGFKFIICEASLDGHSEAFGKISLGDNTWASPAAAPNNEFDALVFVGD